MKNRSHKDVEFHVGDAVFKTPEEGFSAAAQHAVSRGSSVLDVVVWSRAGARWLQGDAGVEMYDEDPDASVFERIEFQANVVGMVR